MADPRVVAELKRQGRGKPRKHAKAAFETGIVESGLRNLEGGDADSAGWRQERASLYKDPTSIRNSVRRFYDEAAKHDRGQPSWELAADVQRPAAQYRGRYKDVAKQAEAFLDGLTGAGSGSSGGSVSGASGSATHRVTSFDEAGFEKAQGKAVLGRLIAKRNPRSFLLRSGVLGTEDPQREAFTSTTTKRVKSSIPGLKVEGGGSGGGGGKGRFKITGPNPGRLKPGLVSFAEKVAGEYGKTITGSDGTGHSYRTATGGVSQHTTGEATDIPASGKELLRMGRAALIAAGMPRAQAMKAQGGLYNVGGHQIIFHDRQQVSGSPHDDHLHISARGGRKR